MFLDKKWLNVDHKTFKVESIHMKTITEMFATSVQYTTDYLKDFFTANVNGNIAKVDAILIDMINGAKTYKTDVCTV